MNELRERFVNITQGKKIIYNKVGEVGENNKFTWNRLNKLAMFHPTKKIGTIDYFVFRKRPPYNNLSLYYKEVGKEEEDDISIIYCLRNIFGKIDLVKEKKKDIISGFRTEIHDGARLHYLKMRSTGNNYGYNNTQHCDNCGGYGKIAVDHYPVPFCDLLNDFLVCKKIKIEEVEVEEQDNVMKIKDRFFGDTWKIYHDNKAEFRLLCARCNSSFGNYKKNVFN